MPYPPLNPDPSRSHGNAPTILVDLISDTSTRPDQAMREAMANAPVGDEQLGEDPTVNALNHTVAQMLGKEDALFLPSGTMANQIALAVHCGSGDAILAAHNAHIISSEGAGAAVLAGAFIKAINCSNGVFDAEILAQHWRAPTIKSPRVRVIAVEQTNNRGGGAIWPLATLQSVANFAKENGLIMHMDGARLLNAVVASGVSARDYASTCDSVWIDLSKGLGCPVGSVLAGSKTFIEQANVWKHRLGGAMRQAGIIAAAGLYALQHNIEALAEDHRRTQQFANALRQMPDIRLLHDEVPTNLVFFDVKDTGKTAVEVARLVLQQGVRIGVDSETSMRAVFHRDIDDAGLQQAITAITHAIR